MFFLFFFCSFIKKRAKSFVNKKKVSTFAAANRKCDAPVAQLVEHLTLNQGVQGSSPCGCTKLRGEQKFTFFVVMFGTSIV